MHRLYIRSEHQDRYLALANDAALPDLLLTESLADADIVLADPPLLAPDLAQLRPDAWVQSTFAGCDALLALSKRDYRLTNVRGIFGPLMAEYVFGHLLGYSRHLGHYKTMQDRKRWQPVPYKGLAGTHMLVLGTGSIGAHLAKVASGFGMRTTGVSRSGNPAAPFDGVVTTRELVAVLPTADVVVSTLPATAETTGLLDHTLLGLCKQALLFNVGRGPVVDENALLAALDSGAIAHAFLDVFCQEPLPQPHPFWEHPAMTVTPHISAVSFPDQVFAIFSENYRCLMTLLQYSMASVF